jgi:pilus assembly protein CpaE
MNDTTHDPGLVLVVEDSPTQGQKMSTMIKVLCGLNVTIAMDGIEALRMIEANPPDVIVLDVELPGMNGYQVCRRLKRDKHTAHIPIIMLTAADSSEAAVHGLVAGADDYIPKDEFGTENLIASLRNYLNFH